MKAPQLKIQQWLNTENDYHLDVAAPKIKVIHAFQMLCPGCVYHGIPQTMEIYESTKDLPVEVVGLHTVFEHHEVMGPEALKVFIKEWRIPFPVGVDQHSRENWMPETMKAYGMQGTPTTIIIDQNGELVLQHFGVLNIEKLMNFVTELSKQIQTTKQA